MASEVIFSFLPSQTAYFLIFDKNSRIWNLSGGTNGAFETWTDGNYANYANSCTQLGASAFYTGTFPTSIPGGKYGVSARLQAGGVPIESDTQVAGGEIEWGGAATVPLSDLATSGQIAGFAPIRLARGNQILNFPFKLVSSIDHNTPFTSGLVSGQIMQDGAAFTSLQSGSLSGGVGYTEVGKGWYVLRGLTSGDLLCNTAALTFTAAGVSGGLSDQRDIAIILQRVSGA